MIYSIIDKIDINRMYIYIRYNTIRAYVPTLEGRNPAPVGRWFIHDYPAIIPLFYIMFISSQCFTVTNGHQLVQDFPTIHCRYYPPVS